MLPTHRQRIIDALERAVAAVIPEETASAVSLERPKQATHGDAACNIALQMARQTKQNPRALAEKIVAVLQADDALREVVAAVEIAGPGFINLRLSQQAHVEVLRHIDSQGDDFGRVADGGDAPPAHVLLEFVSANPTGPLHVGHGRQAALGDVLANVLQTQGLTVQREFYYNDAGAQIQTLARSVQARARGLQPGGADWPENAYNGEYIADIAHDFLQKKTVQAADGAAVGASGDVADLLAIERFAVAYLRHEQDLDLTAFGVRFDRFYLESSLYSEGKVEEAVQGMTASGHTYEADGALWLKTTDYGDDKDRVMRKSEGGYTYFVPDVAYHLTKWRRGFTQAVNIQGSDHHGTIARVRAGLQALNAGIPDGYPDYVLHKMVTVMRGGQEVKISKRAGSYVTLRDLIVWCGGADEARPLSEQPEAMQRGRDAVRFFLVSRKADTEFVFDVDLALAQTDENPVYYVQYAHARICSILLNAEGDVARVQPDLALLVAPRETALMVRLAEYGDVLRQAATERAPHHIAFYLRDLAADFHAFYGAERVLVDDDALRYARLALLAAVRWVLVNGLSLLGVSAPQRM
jgi:arginyl-tRNA synthetase